ncbi:hypothetical protein IFT48_01290 [Pseudomonas fluorescens]|uniref:hypothetical protein n=1 Tax=Pseudomonas fluorescens TaxID=294 RepID=UPI001930BB98|nr:hypothetical protein [Pseudomonas fluorescens]MBD8088608.1 hypothetical protein [Pseudomonas fluorescens]
MKFKSLGGADLSISESDIIEMVEGLDIDGSPTLTASKRRSIGCFTEAIHVVMCIVASKPNFLRGDETWILSYLHEIKNKFAHLDQFKFPSIHPENIYGIFLSEKDQDSSFTHESAIKKTRIYYVIDLIDALLYGGTIGDFIVRRKKPKFHLSFTIKPLIEVGEVYGFGRKIASITYSSRLKSYESNTCFSEYMVAFKDDSLDIYSQLEKFKHFGLYAGEIVTFYKNTNYSMNSKFYPLLPLSKLHHKDISCRLFSYPFLLVQINTSDYENNNFGYRIYVPLANIAGGATKSFDSDKQVIEHVVSFNKNDHAEKSLINLVKIEQANRDLLYKKMAPALDVTSKFLHDMIRGWDKNL